MIFTTTIIVTLATDLLVGIGVGILVKLISQYILGAPLSSMFKARVQDHGDKMEVLGAAVFSNWLGINKVLSKKALDKNLVLDLSRCNVVDHTVMENLHHLHRDFEVAGGHLTIVGLEELEYSSKSKHEMSARKRPKDSRVDKLGNIK